MIIKEQIKKGENIQEKTITDSYVESLIFLPLK